MKNKITSFITIALTFSCFPKSVLTVRTPLIKVIIAPDHKDWTYKVNETAKFSVQVLQYGNLLENVTVDYEAGPEMLPDIKKEGVVLKNGKLEFSGTMKVPGFYRVRVWAVVDGRRYEGLATAGFEPEKIEPTVKDPADFDSFLDQCNCRSQKTQSRSTHYPDAGKMYKRCQCLSYQFSE